MPTKPGEGDSIRVLDKSLAGKMCTCTANHCMNMADALSLEFANKIPHSWTLQP